MRADYDSKADTLAIDLEVAERADYGDDQTHRAAVVHVAGGQVVAIDLLSASNLDVDNALGVIAGRYELDLQALTAAARSALAAPDRPVVVEVGARAAT